MIYKRKPTSFSPSFEVVSCFVRFDDKLLFLKRQKNKSQPEKWGIPTGKVNDNESLPQAMTRELFEETGIKIDKKDLTFLKTIYVNHGYEFSYHMYSLLLDKKPVIKLSESEHSSFEWIEEESSFQLNLVDDLDECIKMYLKFSKCQKG